MMLPMVAVFVWGAMNDRDLLGENGVNSRLQNLATGAVVTACVTQPARPRSGN
jgi:hypothetical protein